MSEREVHFSYHQVLSVSGRFKSLVNDRPVARSGVRYSTTIVGVANHRLVFYKHTGSENREREILLYSFENRGCHNCVPNILYCYFCHRDGGVAEGRLASISHLSTEMKLEFLTLLSHVCVCTFELDVVDRRKFSRCLLVATFFFLKKLATALPRSSLFRRSGLRNCAIRAWAERGFEKADSDGHRTRTDVCKYV